MAHRFVRVGLKEAAELQKDSTRYATELAFLSSKFDRPLAPRGGAIVPHAAARGSAHNAGICSRRRPWRR